MGNIVNSDTGEVLLYEGIDFYVPHTNDNKQTCFCPVCRGDCETEFNDSMDYGHGSACVCVECLKKHRDWHRAIQNSARVKKGESMLPSPKNLPAPDGSTGAFDPWLKAKDIKGKGATKLVLTGQVAESGSQFGDGINVQVKVGAKAYSFTVKFSSANYRILYERFGSNSKKWKGSIQVKVDTYLGNKYIKILD